MEQVNMSRLSHGARAASFMRRCMNEALAVAGDRIAFGDYIENKLLRRQLMKLMVPAEEVLSMVKCSAT